MSKQLAISAAASVFAMVAFVLVATPHGDLAGNEAGAMVHAAAPAGPSVSLEAGLDLQSIIR